MDIKKDILWRVNLTFVGVLILSLAIMMKIAFVQYKQGAHWAKVSDLKELRMQKIRATRGTIFSSDQSMLSVSIARYDLYMDFSVAPLRASRGKLFYTYIDSLTTLLLAFDPSKSFLGTKSFLTQAYKEQKQYVLIAKNLSFEHYKKFKQSSFYALGKYTAGYIVEKNDVRLYPYGSMAKRTLGLTRDNAPNVGIEARYNEELTGQYGKRLVRKILPNVFIPLEENNVEPEKGKNIHTTIDVNVQDILEKALMRMLQKVDATWGTCIVMDVKTGKIVGISNLQKGSKDSVYHEDLNYALIANEPGSTLKLYSMMSLLEDKKIKLDDTVNIYNGKWVINKDTVKDAERHGSNICTAREAFEVSSNVGIARMVYKAYKKEPEKFLRCLSPSGLTSKTGLDIVGESKPYFNNPSAKEWKPTSMVWLSFGYGMLMSPIQILNFYNSIANNGKMMKPYLVSAIEKEGEIIRRFQPEVKVEKICSEETLAQLKLLLEGVVDRGTAKEIKPNAYTMAGKTGTAIVHSDKGYKSKIYQSSFVGYFPAQEARYSCIVVVQNKANAPLYYGAKVAAPVFREIADKLIANNYIQYYLNQDSNARQVVMKTAPSLSLTQRTMPDLRNYSLSEVITFLGRRGIQVNVVGVGKIKEQSVMVGESLKDIRKVIIQLG